MKRSHLTCIKLVGASIFLALVVLGSLSLVWHATSLAHTHVMNRRSPSTHGKNVA